MSTLRVEHFDRSHWSPYDLDGIKAAVVAEGFEVRKVSIFEETAEHVIFEIIERCPCRAMASNWDSARVAVRFPFGPYAQEEVIAMVGSAFHRHRLEDEIQARAYSQPIADNELARIDRAAVVHAEIEAVHA